MAGTAVAEAGGAGQPVSAPTASGQLPAAPSAVILDIKPPDTSMTVGQETTFEAAVDGVKDLYGGIITLAYNPKVVEFKTASEGAFLKKDGRPTSFLFSNNVSAGTVDLYLTRIGNVGGVSGSGSLVTVVFQGKSGGMSELAIKSVKLTNFRREPVRSEARNAKVAVK